MKKTSKLLINESPLQVLPSLAEAIGLNEAIVLQQIHYWLQRTDHADEGGRWVYKTYSQWEEEFPFWSRSTIRRAIKSLRDDELIMVDHRKRSDGDHRNYYRINYRQLSQVARAQAADEQGGVQNEQGDVQDEQDPPARMNKGGVQNEQIYNKDTETTTETSAERARAREGNPENPPTDVEENHQGEDPAALIEEGFGIRLRSTQKDEIRHLIDNIHLWKRIIRDKRIAGKTHMKAVGWAVKDYQKAQGRPGRPAPTTGSGVSGMNPDGTAYGRVIARA